MIYYFIPYALDKKLFNAFDRYMSLVNDPDAWVCFLDGDTAFLLPDWGRVIEDYTRRYPDSGLLTCYASRCHYQCQTHPEADMNQDSIIYHRNMAEKAALSRYQVDEVNRRIAGHLMVMRKRTWMLIRNEVIRTAASKMILGVDTKISNAIIAKGLKIRIMKGLYIFHYLRMKEGFDFKGHLL